MLGGVVVLIVIALLCYAIVQYSRRQAARISFIDSYAYEKLVSPQLREKMSYVDDQQWPFVVEGLRQYFRLCHRSGSQMVAMPSNVVDDLWHEFILDTRAYQDYCHKGFGRFLHHVPAQAMKSPTVAQAGIKHAWRLACEDEKINPQKPINLPLLFALDSRLQVPGGFYYSLNCKDKEGNFVVGSGHYCATHIGCSGSKCGGVGVGCSGGGCGSS